MDFDPIDYLNNDLNIDSLEYLISLYIMKKCDPNYKKDNKTVLTILLEYYNGRNVDEYALIFLHRLLQLGYKLKREEFSGMKSNKLVKECKFFLKEKNINERFYYSRDDVDYFSRIDDNVHLCALNIGNFIMITKNQIESYREILFSRLIQKYHNDISLKIDKIYTTTSSEDLPLYEFYICSLGQFISYCKNHPDLNMFIYEKMKELIEKIKFLNEIGIVHGNLNMENIVFMPDLSLRIIDFSKSIFLGMEKTQDEERISNKTYRKDNKIFYVNGKIYLSYTTDMYHISCIYYSCLKRLSKIKFLLFYSNLYEIKNNELFDVDMSGIQDIVILLKKTVIHQSNLRLSCEEVLDFFENKQKSKKFLSVTSFPGCKTSSKDIILGEGNMKYLESFYDIHDKDIITYKKGLQDEITYHFGNIDDVFIYRNLYIILNNKNINIKDLKPITLLKDVFKTSNIEERYSYFLKQLVDIKFVPIFFSDIIESFICIHRLYNMNDSSKYVSKNIDNLFLENKKLDGNVVKMIRNFFE